MSRLVDLASSAKLSHWIECASNADICAELGITYDYIASKWCMLQHCWTACAKKWHLLQWWTSNESMTGLHVCAYCNSQTFRHMHFNATNSGMTCKVDDLYTCSSCTLVAVGWAKVRWLGHAEKAQVPRLSYQGSNCHAAAECNFWLSGRMQSR